MISCLICHVEEPQVRCMRGRKTKVGRKLLRFPPTRLETEEEPEEILENFEGYSYL